MEDTPTKAFSTDPSPKKKRRISKSRLLQKLISDDGFYRIGQIYQLARKTSLKTEKNGDEKGNEEGSLKPIDKVCLRNFKLRCVVTDNRNGREPKGDIERSFRFINVADATGTITLGMRESDAQLFGVTAFDLEEKERSETAFCFFNAEISGSITWIQSSKETVGVPTFYLNNGSLKEMKDLDLSEHNKTLIYPKTDVCRMMVTSKYVFSNRSATTGICGRIDELDVKTNQSVVMSLEDPVRYIAVEIDCGNSVLKNPARKFIDQNVLKKGKAIFLGGKLHLGVMRGEENAIITVSDNDISINHISHNSFMDFVKWLCHTDADMFMGIMPESMSDRTSNEENR